MSRVGKNPVMVPDGVSVEVKPDQVKAKGKLGELTLPLIDEVSVKIHDERSDVASRNDASIIVISPFQVPNELIGPTWPIRLIAFIH